MGDIRIIETGDGGDAVLTRNDIEVIQGFQNMAYLGAFGGNLEESSTTNIRRNDEQLGDWWGNNLLMFDNPSIQFNSELERTLSRVALTSSGRREIINAAMGDLSFMREFSSVVVEARITNNDRVEILMKIQEPTNKNSNEFTYIWDSTKQELITNTP